MNSNPSTTPLSPAAADLFPQTQWTVIQRDIQPNLGDGTQLPTGVMVPLGELLKPYYPALLVVARRSFPPEDAEDVVQDFLARNMTDPVFLRRFDRTKGRLRSYIRECFHCAIVDRIRYQMAAKRGGQAVSFSLDDPDMAAAELPVELRSSSAWERDFDREWAIGLRDRVLESMRETQYRKHPERFEVLLRVLSLRRPWVEQGEAAEMLCTTPDNVRTLVKRFRDAFTDGLQSLIRRECLPPDATEEDFAAEWRALQSAIAREAVEGNQTP